jgi:outer membrane protein assembly factor BamB
MPGRRRLPLTARWTAAIGAAVVLAALAVIVTAVIAGRGPSCGTPVWGQLQADPGHDGSVEGGGGRLKVRWTRAADASGGLVLVGDELLVSSRGGITALSPDDGSVRWRWWPVDGRGSNVGPAAVRGCAVGVVESRPDQTSSGVHGVLHVVSLSSHEPIANLDIPSVSAGGLLATSSSFQLVGARPASGGFDWGLFAVDPENGHAVRLATVGAFAPGPPAADGGTTFVAAWDSAVRAVDRGGRQLWRTATAALPLTTPVVSGGRVVVGTIGGVEALDAGSGRVLWTASIASGVVVAPLPLGDGVLVVDRTSHRLHRLDARTGHVTWEVQLGAATLAPPVAVGSRVLVADEAGQLLAVDAGSGRVLQRLTLRAGVRNPVAAGGGSLYVVGNDGAVSAVSLG